MHRENLLIFVFLFIIFMGYNLGIFEFLHVGSFNCFNKIWGLFVYLQIKFKYFAYNKTLQKWGALYSLNVQNKGKLN